MSRSKVAILRTSPRTVLADYHRLMNLAGYQDVIAKTPTPRSRSISAGTSSTRPVRPRPGKLEGVVRAMERRRLHPALIHGCHNRTVVHRRHLGERGKQTGQC